MSLGKGTYEIARRVALAPLGAGVRIQKAAISTYQTLEAECLTAGFTWP